MSFYTFLPKLVNMSLTAGVVIMLVLVARLLLKKAPKVISYALWGIVLIRLLCPVSIESDFSLFGLMDTPVEERGTITSAIEYVPNNIVHTEYPNVVLPIPGVSEIINDNLPQGEEQMRADPLEGPIFIATYVWMAGVLGMVIYAAVSYLRLRRQLLTAIHLRDNICTADGITSPFVMGLFRPKIYLPSAMEAQEQSYIILHEQHHIRRLDHIVKAVAFVALCIHWFNPLVWVAFIMAGKDMEMSCDEAVVKKMGESVLADYTASLLSLATGKHIIAGMPLAFGEGDTKGRIRNLANWKKPAFWVILVTVSACVVLAVTLLTNPVHAAIDPSEVESVAIDGTAVSQARQDELIDLLNEHRKSSFQVGADDPNSLSVAVEIHCADGSWYLLHYQYYSGFSFSPKHPGEDDYRSILTRFGPDGKASDAWKLEYEFDSKFIKWYRNESAFGTESYAVVEATYQSPLSSFAMIIGENTPSYTISADMLLASSGEHGETDEWISLGTMTEVTLTKENFDELFASNSGAGWASKQSASVIRKDMSKAWTLVYNQSHLYYLLQMKNGEIYLAYGYYDYSEKDDPYSDDTNIRWLLKLAREDKSPVSEVQEWFDYLHSDKMPWNGRQEINVEAFPNTTFRWMPEKVEAIVGDEIKPLYTGMPIWNVFFTDLTGDGLPELCSTLSIGSGMIDNRILIYDYANGVSYELQDRGKFNYTLRLNKEDGALYVDKSDYYSSNLLPSESDVITSGRLAYIDGCVEVLYPDSEHSVASFENTVTEIGRGTLKSTVTLSDEDAGALSSLIESGDWKTGETPACDNDCAINLSGVLVYYHSDCGTMVTYDYSALSTLSSREQSGAYYWALPEADRIFVNNLLLKYISLENAITDIAQPSLNMATLKDLVGLIGEDLTWDDFGPYWYEDVGSGLYIYRYPIDQDYYLQISGASPDVPPMLIRLVDAKDAARYIDVRYEDIDEFISN